MQKIFSIFLSLLLCYICCLDSVNAETNKKLIACSYNGDTTNVLWSGNEVYVENGVEYYYIDDSTSSIYEYESKRKITDVQYLLDEILVNDYIYNSKHILYQIDGIKNGRLHKQQLMIDRHTG